MENFVIKGLNISKSRLYLPPEQGGIGLFDLKNFIAGLQTSWVKRAVSTINDNWKCTLSDLGNGDPTRCELGLNNPDVGPALHNIILSFSKFKTAYNTHSGNYALIPIFENDIFGTGRMQISKFDSDFFTDNVMNRYGDNVRALTWKSILVNGNFVPFGEFEFISGIKISRIQYVQLKQCFLRCQKKYGPPGLEYTSIATYFNKIKKGSKKYRVILNFSTQPKAPIFNLKPVKSYCKTVDSDFESEKRIRNILSSWNLFFLPNRLRVFLFKFYSNILGTGNRIIHFNPTAEVSCHFCTKNLFLPAPIESVGHIFYDCQVVNKIWDIIKTKFFTIPIERRHFFTGQFSENESALSCA